MTKSAGEQENSDKVEKHLKIPGLSTMFQKLDNLVTSTGLIKNRVVRRKKRWGDIRLCRKQKKFKKSQEGSVSQTFR